MVTALFADKNGAIFDAPGQSAVCRTGDRLLPLRQEDLIPLPEGAELMLLPGRQAVSYQQGTVKSLPGQSLAVAAILPVGYTRTYLPAFIRTDSAPVLPLYGYTAVALVNNEIYVAAVRSDDNETWSPNHYNTKALPGRIARVKRDLDGNRLVEHLAHCSRVWHCCTAQNLFYHRWEAGIPTSPVCNANCLGCISLQASECCPSPQSRIKFRPTMDEVAQLGCYHLAASDAPIISFGQGCEGEPALAFEVIAPAITRIRRSTTQGVININTNGGCVEGIKAIVDAGLDSMRVSIISAIEDTYQAYYRSNYTLAEVKASIAYAKQHGVFVSLNMLSFPGLNDSAAEGAAWEDFIRETQIDMVQLRNLNLDPDVLWQCIPRPSVRTLGVNAFIRRLQECNSKLVIGSFSHYISQER